MANFPSSLTPAWTAKTDNLDYPQANDVNLPNQEVVAIEATLGTNPQGGSATVSARIAVLEAAGVVGSDGWISDSHTWTYSSADSPIFVVSVNADMTGLLQAGDRIKLTQTTIKKFLVHSVGSYSGGATLITIYGGTDFTLTNAAISSPAYSHVKSPFGFDVNPSKWSVITSDTNSQSQITSGTTVYNPSGINIVAPIGLWIPSIFVLMHIQSGSASAKYMVASLSTSSSSINSSMAFSIASGDAATRLRVPAFAVFPILTITTKTTYYMDFQDSGGGGNTVYFMDDVATLYITFKSAYL